MAKIRYFVRENSRLGRHSYYAVPYPNGTLTFQELCEEACENTSIEYPVMVAAVSFFIKVVQRNLLKGYRTQLGDDFVTLYPNISLSVKDELDEQGNVVLSVVKKVEDTETQVDCVTGATLTSNGVDAMLKDCLKAAAQNMLKAGKDCCKDAAEHACEHADKDCCKDMKEDCCKNMKEDCCKADSCKHSKEDCCKENSKEECCSKHELKAKEE